jgi:hypothetical protein
MMAQRGECGGTALSLTSALDRGGWGQRQPRVLYPGKETWYCIGHCVGPSPDQSG